MADKKKKYYIYRDAGGNVTRLIKFEGTDPYRYENKDWIFDARFVKILLEPTNYEEISEEEANAKQFN